MGEKQHRAMAATALVVAAFGWAVAPVFIRGLSHAYDPYSQTVVRYGVSAVVLLVVSAAFYRADLVRVVRNPGPMLAISALNVIQQTAWVNACYRVTATLALLLLKLSIVFVIAFSYLLFHEERSVIRSRGYQVGTVLSLVGVALILCTDPGTLAPRLDAGTGLALSVSVFWAIYTVWCKHLVHDVHPVPMFTVLAGYTTLGFIALAFAFGDPHTVVTAGLRTTVIAALSGVIAIAIAHTTFHYAQKHLGSAFCTSLLLLNPLFTNAVALYLWQDEALRPMQWCGAAALITGAMLVVRMGTRAQHGLGEKRSWTP
ncbi:MAG TPA: DMT family transporter [Candidatus Hydrogenedentes bacterium]|nr:DMT family transporter [Candidatus Hydrogenedentota bacterium]HPG68207.1 DMT family transporter [Candidatus Hydrogenedentota bacterium]